MKIENEKILRGIMTILILDKISTLPSHGYSLQVYISEKLMRKVPPGTVYVLLSSMVKRGFIMVSEQKCVNGRPVKIYSITDSGIEFLRDHIDPLIIIQKIVGDLISSISSLPPAAVKPHHSQAKISRSK
ncbi:MAG: PadR family transcriptional regulator [Thermoplasmataceae archaeon]|jgi:DNA-binding PadR family transcriptional regulator